MKRPYECNSIEEIRNEIDRIDLDIINQFYERHLYVEEIAKYKTDIESAIAIERKNQVINQRSAWAAGLGLNSDLFSKIYSVLLEFNIQHEIEILDSKKQVI